LSWLHFLKSWSLRQTRGGSEQGEIGPDLFRKACEFGFEGLVSKHRDRSYRAGKSPNWVKVKNPKHPAMTRVMEAFR
jgi:bifunctional non-homologous end joining protein LigD